MGTTIKAFSKEMSVLIPSIHRGFLKRLSRPIVKSDVSFAQMAIMGFLIQKKKSNMTEIANALSVSTSAATGLVDRMVRSGLLKRFHDSMDRRVIYVSLTPKGKKIMNGIFRQRQRVIMDVFKYFTSDEREAYLKLVKRIYGILKGKKK